MQVTRQIVQHLTANMNLSRKEILFNNFLGGLAWGFGSVVGAGAVVAIVGSVLQLLGVFTFVGDFFNQLFNALS